MDNDVSTERSAINPHLGLRDATAPWHASTERAFEQFDLRHREGYVAFLLAQAGALLPLEDAVQQNGIDRFIADWGVRRRGNFVLADLERLGVPRERIPVCRLPDASYDPLAIAYVLEGSRHGARVLLRRMLTGDPALANATMFLGQPFQAKQWTIFLDILRQNRGQPDQQAHLQETGIAGFRLFTQSAEMVAG
ncbi:biliverdin-producing heme oxygenase [Lichenihabitans psoromatis]|uniref:biliverdin-producing heme oxygenase n=1 Tax=Lichenihabitans psoromatis TaxID=2528642 RepID=UPI00103836A7|nr:biliverdin-producing heme oxygenase [Lichenihabitans psoromatis]